ncbi:MAG TPA: LuxR C-terminal-related transcriptional regulator [Angustibacter sp.]|nr:LuxR C-terminal-related transcriptional regulator [Angustibacter sp.]
MGDASGGGAGRGSLQRARERGGRAAATSPAAGSGTGQAALHRPRLEERIEAGLARGLVVVSAPAGAGKTQLLTAWAQTHDGPVAWLTLVPDDRDPMHLWARVLTALQRRGEAPADSVLARLQPTPVLDERFVTRLLDAWDGLPTPVVLLLEDVQVLDGSDGARSLSDAVRRGPGHLPLIVASRSEPDLQLHRLRLTEAVTEIDAGDLAFTLDEAAELFDRSGVHLDDGQLLQVLERTEGWAAGLRLALLLLQGQPDLDTALARLTGDHRPIADYFAREVLDQLGPDVLDFMVRTSVTSPLDADLAAELSGRDDAGAVLEHLYHERLFVVALDEQRQWYRYHHLLAGVLRQRLAALPSGVEHELHRRAASWWRRHGDDLQAARQLAAAGDWHELGVLTCTSAGALVFDVSRTALAGTLVSLPAALRAGDPWVAAAAAFGAYGVYDAAGVRDHLAQARGALGAVSDDERIVLEAVLLVLDTVAAWLEDDLERQVAVAPVALSQLAVLGSAAVPALAAYRTAARSVLGMAQLWSGQLAQAEATLGAVARALAADPEPNALRSVHIHGALGVIAAIQGRLRDAEERGREALRTAEDSGWLYLPQAARGHLALAMVQLSRSETAPCRETLDRAFACLRALPNRFIETALDITDARLRVSDGDLAGAETVMARLRAMLATWQPSAYLLHACDAVESEIAVARGDAELVVARFASRGRPTTVYEVTVLARAELLVGQPVQALELLAPLHADPPAELARAVDLWLLTAVAREALGERFDARAAVREAVELAADEGLTRPFLLLRRDVSPLLLANHSPRRHPEFVRHLLDLLQQPPVAAPDVPSLTERELSTLRLLPTMMTNAEIAEAQFVSVNTVKSHLKSLYRKLGVAGRREAVVIARELGLVR